ncbi:Putative DNA-binding domain protein [uncultured archaeon]|nr:Putative DNA-binding domain protein [uncultured archaeon]
MVAFSNTKGGNIIVGVDNDSNIIGLSGDDINRLNQLISNAATENVKPSINPFTEIIKVGDKKILVISVQEGYNKPYCTNEGIYLVKVGSDKRKISQEELQRLFQESKKIMADKSIISDSSLKDIDKKLLSEFYQKTFNKKIESAEIGINKILENLYLAKNGNLTLAGLLLFGKNPQRLQPVFKIKAISYFGNDPAGTKFRDSDDITGNLLDQFKKGMGFLTRNLRKIQVNENFNIEGEIEIPIVALEELLINALMHRDYFISSPIILFIFDNRVEIISPGRLPNNLTIENIKNGVSISRNQVIMSFASKILPYRGVGTGIIRALRSYNKIEFINDIETERFKVIIHRV